MKEFRYYISKYDLCPYFPIRGKQDIINIVLSIAKAIAITPFDIHREIDENEYECILHIDKMSRIFLGIGSSIHSLHFPFTVLVDENATKSSFDGYTIDSYVTSVLMAAQNAKYFWDGSIEECFCQFSETCDSYSISTEREIHWLWNIMMHLMLFEPGYIRYDLDEERAEKRRHPLHHLDIYYSGNTTCKVGLKHPLSIDDLIDFLDVTTDCLYIENDSKRRE